MYRTLYVDWSYNCCPKCSGITLFRRTFVTLQTGQSNHCACSSEVPDQVILPPRGMRGCDSGGCYIECPINNNGCFGFIDTSCCSNTKYINGLEYKYVCCWRCQEVDRLGFTQGGTKSSDAKRRQVRQGYPI